MIRRICVFCGSNTGSDPLYVQAARTLGQLLAREGINIQMISTSEIKISIVIEDKYLELAVRALHKAFGLDQPA